MSELPQRLRHTPIPSGVPTIRAWLGSDIGVTTGLESIQTASVDDRRSSDRSLLIDEVISAVHRHALEICEQHLLSSRARLSNEQAQMTRTVIVAIVDRLLAVPAARMNAASEGRDYAKLLLHLFEAEPEHAR